MWQRRLRLQDWNVRLVVKAAEDMDDTFAKILPQLDSKKAVMHVCNPSDASSADTRLSGVYDIEEYIVHELLHLYTEPLEPEDSDSAESRVIEQAVGVLANCIVRLSREQ